jgi:hypothetical protein
VPKGGRGIPPHNCKKASWPEKAGVAAAPTKQPGVGKLVKAVVGGKLHRRGGKAHFPCEL